MIHEAQQELACLYAAGALPPDEARRFESALREDAALREFTRRLQKVGAALALGGPAATPSAGLRAGILAALPASSTLRVEFPREKPSDLIAFPWLPWALAACVTVLCALLVLRTRSLHLEREQLAATRQRQQIEIVLLQTTLDELRAQDRVSQMRIAMLGSLLESSPKAMAVSLWDAEKQDGVLVVQNLTPLPTDQDYQLWVIDPQRGAPVDAGVFTVDAKGTVRFHFKPKSAVLSADKFAVTVEKKGGRAAPQGTMVLAGTWL